MKKNLFIAAILCGSCISANAASMVTEWTGDHYGDCVKLCMFSWWVLKSSVPDPEPEEERERDGGE